MSKIGAEVRGWCRVSGEAQRARLAACACGRPPPSCDRGAEVVGGPPAAGAPGLAAFGSGRAAVSESAAPDLL